MAFFRSLALLAGILTLASASVSRANDDEIVLSRIVFGSCAHQDRPQPIWKAITASNPDIFLFLGDNIYADTKEIDKLKATYDKFAAHPEFAEFKKKCKRCMATWDDHDYGWNDAGEEYPLKEQSQQLFLDFFGYPADSPLRKQKGVYNARIFGPEGKRVQIIMLDTRYFRSPLRKALDGFGYMANNDPKATILGEEQWRWLESELRKPADLRIIGSSIQLVAEDHPFEKWMNIPAERERFFKLIRNTKAKGVVVISGDRHLAELSVMDAKIGYPLFDLTSSGINQATNSWRPLEKNQHRVATMNVGNNFGLLLLDWERPAEKGGPSLTFQIRDTDNEVTISHTIPLTLLKVGKVIDPDSTVKLEAGVIAPAEAAEQVGKKVTVQMPVRSVGKSGPRVFLNSKPNFRDEGNFAIVVQKEALDQYQAKNIDPSDYFRNKIIQVTGTVTLYRDSPQIEVRDAEQIRVVGGKE